MGTLRSFVVCAKLDCSQFKTVGARAQAVGAHVAIYVDTLAPAPGLDSADIDTLKVKQIYVERSDFLRALACVDRILLLVPDLPRELRDRGILYQRLECFAAALRDFERYLKLAPDDQAAALIRDTLPDLQRRAAQLQ